MDITYEDQPQQNLSDYIRIARLRSKPMLITIAAVMVMVIIALVIWQPTYRSTAVILIEEQDVPSDLVRSTITSYAVQRIEEIRQKIMTVGNIISIIERFEVYDKDERRRNTRTELALEFRDDVKIEPISADVIDPRSGRPTQAVIAFNLSFDGANAATVHKVTNELVTLYLNENVKERTKQSNSTSEFITTEAQSINIQLKEMEEEISVFKEEHHNSLPELYNFNLGIIDRIQRELLDIRTRVQELKKQRIQLASDLARLSPYAPTVLPSGEAVLGNRDRLKSLQSEYRRKSAIYQPNHPDVVRLEQEIDNLLSELGNTSGRGDLVKELRNTREQLAQAREKYTQDHPIIEQLTRTVKKLEEELNTTLATDSPEEADSPTYVLIQTQLRRTESELESLSDKENKLEQKIQEHESFILNSPSVEKKYQALLRDYDNARLKYREIKAKQLDAELSKNLEEERKGERFTLIQPPEIPEEPIKPNRPLLFILGSIIAVGMGLVVVAIIEAFDPKVYGEKSIIRITGLTPLVSVPYMVDDRESSTRKNWLRGSFVSIPIAILLTVVLFHFFVKPLDVTWYILLHKAGLN